MADISSVLELTFNHIAFPPKLPGTRDAKVKVVEKDILTRLRTTVHTIKAYSSVNDAISIWEGIKESLEICQFVNEIASSTEKPWSQHCCPSNPTTPSFYMSLSKMQASSYAHLSKL
jgi:hypothetical protein